MSHVDYATLFALVEVHNASMLSTSIWAGPQEGVVDSGGQWDVMMMRWFVLMVGPGFGLVMYGEWVRGSCHHCCSQWCDSNMDYKNADSIIVSPLLDLPPPPPPPCKAGRENPCDSQLVITKTRLPFQINWPFWGALQWKVGCLVRQHFWTNCNIWLFSNTNWAFKLYLQNWFIIQFCYIFFLQMLTF